MHPNTRQKIQKIKYGNLLYIEHIQPKKNIQSD